MIDTTTSSVYHRVPLSTEVLTGSPSCDNNVILQPTPQRPILQRSTFPLTLVPIPRYPTTRPSTCFRLIYDTVDRLSAPSTRKRIPDVAPTTPNPSVTQRSAKIGYPHLKFFFGHPLHATLPSVIPGGRGSKNPGKRRRRCLGSSSSSSSSSSSQALPSPSLGTPLTSQTSEALRRRRRQAANARERKRMTSLNSAFDRLRATLPSGTHRLSKRDTIQMALNYIAELFQRLQEDEEERREEDEVP